LDDYSSPAQSKEKQQAVTQAGHPDETSSSSQLEFEQVTDFARLAL